MTPIILEQSMFRDSETYQEVIRRIRGAHRSPVFAGQELLGTVLSPEASKQVLYEGLLKWVADEPGLVDEIGDRQNDEIVD